MTILTRRAFSIGLLATAAARPFGASAQRSDQPRAACEAKKALVIRAAFPDIAPPIQEAFVRERFAKLDAYVREMSYGMACVPVDVTDWLRLPDPIGRYAISPANLAVDKSRVERLIQHAIDAADGQHDFSRYAFLVLFLGASFKEYGMVGLCGYPGMLGWRNDTVFRTGRGQVVPGGIAIFTYQAHMGTLFHDVAHVIGGVREGKRGVPCLYDHDIQAKHPTQDAGFAEALVNMGYWDPMSCHFRRRDLPPPGVSSWTKLRLGWLPPHTVHTISRREVSEVLLDPIEDGAARILAIRIPLGPSTFYLIENRQPLGAFDPHLPGHGVLVLYCNDAVAECRGGESPVKLRNANPSVPHLQGAAFDLPDRPVFTDPAHGIEIRLLARERHSYRLRITLTG